MSLHSYVVRYDSGFAPNPFFGFCTLATCKPDIRRTAQIGDWIVGTGSADKSIRLGGTLVHAMRVTETLTTQEYFDDPRFLPKRPNLRGSKKRACGDNVYHWNSEQERWEQLDSFHTRADGTVNSQHVQRDTGVQRILVSEDFVYFGGSGPQIPEALRNHGGSDICTIGRGRKRFDDPALIEDFVTWLRALGQAGYIAQPFDWSRIR